jgi:superfamily II DNA or RNA helicase
MMLHKAIKMFGYIYIRETIYRKFCNVVKIGITENLANREATYITGEFIRGKYISAYEVPLSELHAIDGLLKEKLLKYNRIDESDGGTEFYHESVLEIIDTMMDSYRKLSEEELEEIKRISLHKPKPKIDAMVPRDYQKTIVSKSQEYFETNDKGLLVLMCGMGKTLISLWISQAMNATKILIGVPNKLLLEQWEKEVRKIFPNFPILAIEGGITEAKIQKFHEENEKFVVITTYHSSYKLELFEYDIKIFDEVHHLTSTNIDTAQEHNSFIRILNVRAKKQLGLTATMKELENFEKSVSNNDKLIFGEIIDEKNLLWAIERDVITDYQIQAIQVREECLSIKGNILMVAAYCAVESIRNGNSNHMLIYFNSTENAIKIIEYVKQFNPELFSSSYHSGMTLEVQAQILKIFSESSRGIVSCVYCLGEGWDFPKLDAVLFAEKMTSNIRIVQSALRACRKNKDSPQKIAKIILPVLYKENWLEDNTNDDLKKIREVIYQMSMEDERIIQKIIFSEILSDHSGSGQSGPSRTIVNDEITSQLILKTIHRNQLGITYEKSKQIIREEKKRMPIESQKDYLELCKCNTKLHEDPQNHFGEQFIDWCDYLSIEEKYYDFGSAKAKIQEYLLSDYDETFGYMNLASQICQSDKNFPPVDLWTSYYKVSSINALFVKKKDTKFDFL